MSKAAEFIEIEETLFSRDGAPGDVRPERPCRDWLPPDLRPTADKVVEIVEGGKISLPMLPKVAQQALVMARDENASFKEVEGVIRHDPVITAKLLQVANSPFYGMRRQLTSCRQAMMLLGLEELRKVLIQAVVEAHVFRGQKAAHLERERDHAVAVAQVAQAVAKMLGLDAVDAFQCGMLHDIGRIVLPSLASKLPAGMVPADGWRRVLDAIHAEIGSYLLALWDLPDSVREAAARHHRHETTEKLGASRIGLIVAVAEGLVHRRGFGNGEPVPPMIDPVEGDPIWAEVGIAPPQVTSLVELVNAIDPTTL